VKKCDFWEQVELLDDLREDSNSTLDSLDMEDINQVSYLYFL
jgi:hypothetical protein